jgi:hypothetical protein
LDWGQSKVWVAVKSLPLWCLSKCTLPYTDKLDILKMISKIPNPSEVVDVHIILQKDRIGVVRELPQIT